MTKIEFKSIGIIHSPFKDLEGMPIQPIGARGIKGEIYINNEYKDGLKDFEGFSHIILIYYLHLSKGHLLKVKPFLDTEQRGIFEQERQNGLILLESLLFVLKKLKTKSYIIRYRYS